MAYQVTTNNAFILDGDELQAGERVFLRDMRLFAVEGEEAGSAAMRMFVRDSRAFSISGGSAARPEQSVTATVFYAIDGSPSGPAIHMAHGPVIIDGVPGNTSINAVRASSAFIIEVE